MIQARTISNGWDLSTRKVVIGEQQGTAPETGGAGRVAQDWKHETRPMWSSYDIEGALRPEMNLLSKTLLRVFFVVLLAWQTTMTIYLAAGGFYDMTMFTFWNYTLLSTFVATMTAALFYERWLLTGALLFLLPMLLGTTLLVQIGIVIIVARNGNVFLGDGSQSVANRHTGDFIVHTVPIGSLLLSLIAGLILYIRRALCYQLGLFRTRTRRVIYYVYWVLCPLLPLAIYTACFDIAVKYPTGIPTGLLWLALIGVNVVWMCTTLLFFVAIATFSIQLTSFWQRRGEELGTDQHSKTLVSHGGGDGRPVSNTTTGLVTVSSLARQREALATPAARES